MNLLLLTPDDRDGARWRVAGRRAEHIRRVLGLAVGDSLACGELNGDIGRATLLADDGDRLELEFSPQHAPPAPSPIILIVALPRPKMLKRMLIDATSLGIKRIVLLNSAKVEKSYWQTPNLKAALLEEKMLLGLEQARDTVLPELLLRPRFKPFVEDELDTLAGNGQRLLAHPGNYPPIPAGLDGPMTLAIGPEGGWTDYEVGMFEQRGFACHSFGERILRVETALPAMIGRLRHL